MKMEISARDKKLLVYMLAIAIVAGTYFFVAKPFMTKTETLNTEVERLQSDVNHLTEVYINKDNYENRISEAQRNYNETVVRFLGGLNQDNTLMLVKGLENDTKIWISRISFQEEQFIMGGASSEGEDGNASSGLSGSKQDLSLDYSCSYADFKRFIEYVQNFDKRLFISSINCSYSVDSDQVAGSLILSQYSLTGTGEEYLSPDLSNVETGVENIFTTLKSVPEEEGDVVEMQTITNPDAESLENNDSEVPDGTDSAETGSESNESENDSNQEDNASDENNSDATEGEPAKKPATGLI